jgi:ubiquinone/menaquinone biosynthesis C-methylase UbiE
MLPVHSSKYSVFNYEEIPAGYYYHAMQTGTSPQRFWHQKKFLAVAEHLQGANRVLDFGCGPGSFLSILAERFPTMEAIGVDQASRQIRFARDTISPRYTEGRIRFVETPPGGEQLPFPDESFDAITCIEVVEHIHPYYVNCILRDLARLLKPGGRLIMTTPNYRSLWPLIEFALERMSPVKYHDQHINKLTPNAAAKVLESAGFRLQQVETLFVLSPFFAGISWRAAELMLAAERAFAGYAGNLLIMEATKLGPDFFKAGT